MAKARMLSQEVAEDSKLAHCSLEAAYTYVLTIPFLDRDGLCSGKPSWIAGRALQERFELQLKAGSFIQEWVVQGLVTRYEGSDGPVLFFHGFRKHNAHMAYEKETHSKFPPPPGYHRSEHGLIPDDPEMAGRLIEAFDSRSTYRRALTEAAQNDLHNEVATRSRPGRDEVEPEVEVESQPEVEPEVKTNTMRAFAQAEMALMGGWNGGGGFIDSLDDKELACLISWLWYYNGWNDSDPVEQHHFAARYKTNSLATAKNAVGVIRNHVEQLEFAPLHPSHRESMNRAMLQVTP